MDTLDLWLSRKRFLSIGHDICVQKDISLIVKFEVQSGASLSAHLQTLNHMWLFGACSPSRLWISQEATLPFVS